VFGFEEKQKEKVGIFLKSRYKNVGPWRGITKLHLILKVIRSDLAYN